MPTFDYAAPAELFTSAITSRRGPVRYRRFETVAEAVQYAIEVLPTSLLNNAILETNEERFKGSEIRDLYQDQAYPLRRS
jgi:hypothetical protein